MTYPTLPANLSKIMQSGFQRQLVDTRRRLQTETGPPSFRRRHAVEVEIMSGQVTIERGLTLTLIKFWRETIGYGTSPFWMPDRLLNGRPLSDEDGDTLTDESAVVLTDTVNILCLMSAPPVIGEPNGSYCPVSYSLEILP